MSTKAGHPHCPSSAQPASATLRDWSASRVLLSQRVATCAQKGIDADYRTLTIKRSGVIVGSTNLQDFLSDPTGSRRFWVVPAGEGNLGLLREWREQLLAEAVHLFRQNERHWLSEEEEAQRRDFVSQFTDTDVWEERVLGYAGLRRGRARGGRRLRRRFGAGAVGEGADRVAAQAAR